MDTTDITSSILVDSEYEIDPLTGRRKKKKTIQASEVPKPVTPSSFSDAALARKMRSGDGYK